MLQKIQTPLLGLCPLSGTMWILRRKIFWNFYIQFVCQSKQRQEKQSTCIWMLFPCGNGSPPVKINKCFCMRRTYEEKYITLLPKKWKITWLNGVMLELLPLQEHCPPWWRVTGCHLSGSYSDHRTWDV